MCVFKLSLRNMNGIHVSDVWLFVAKSRYLYVLFLFIISIPGTYTTIVKP